MPSLKFSNTNYRYGFNGKENDPETGTIDFGARAYDARIGRWLSLDPLQSSYPDLSPYNFCNNSPIIFVDPDGQKINWFMSRGALKLRREYVRMGMKAEWKRLVNSPTKITVIVTENVLVSRNQDNGALRIQEGVSINDPKNYYTNKPGETPKKFLKSSIVIISLGVFELKKEVMASYGAKEWSELSTEQKIAGIEKFQGHYNFMLSNEEIVNMSKDGHFELGGGKKKSESDFYKYSVADPLPNESESEFLTRVAGHEDDHSVTAGENMEKTGKLQRNKETNKVGFEINKDKFDELQEKSGYENEGKIIEKQQYNRSKDDDL